MSTISCATIAPATPGAQTRLRITVRGRRLLAGVIALPVAALAMMGVLSGGAAIASHEVGASADTFETVTVMPGDSLWSIAADVAPQADPRDVILAISDLNNLGDAALRAGQSIAIPAEYSAAQ